MREKRAKVAGRRRTAIRRPWRLFHRAQSQILVLRTLADRAHRPVIRCETGTIYSRSCLIRHLAFTSGQHLKPLTAAPWA